MDAKPTPPAHHQHLCPIQSLTSIDGMASTARGVVVFGFF